MILEYYDQNDPSARTRYSQDLNIKVRKPNSPTNKDIRLPSIYLNMGDKWHTAWRALMGVDRRELRDAYELRIDYDRQLDYWLHYMGWDGFFWVNTWKFYKRANPGVYKMHFTVYYNDGRRKTYF